MAKIHSFNFGFIVVDGKQYVCDVLILPDGTVREREASKARLGSHTITWSDVARIANERPEFIVIGTGTSALAKLSEDAGINLRQANLNLVVLPSPQAVEKFNQLTDEGKRVAALIHITC
jgi:hypothetical protein